MTTHKSKQFLLFEIDFACINIFYLNFWFEGPFGSSPLRKNTKKPEVFYTFAGDSTFNCKKHGVAPRIAT